MDIGRRNIQAAKQALRQENIKLVKEEVGGVHGRTVIFDSVSGKVTIRKTGGGEKDI